MSRETMKVGDIWRRKSNATLVYVWHLERDIAWLCPVEEKPGDRAYEFTPGRGSWNEWMLGPGTRRIWLPEGWTRDSRGRISACWHEAEGFVLYRRAEVTS